MRKNSQLLDAGLRDEHPIERIAMYNLQTARRQGVAKADYIKLDELNNPIFNGTTHMMMLGTNNLEIADVILKWVDDNIPTKAKNGKKK